MENLVSFGAAIEALKLGQRVARQGWNGKNMSVYLSRGNLDRNEGDQSHVNGVPGHLFDSGGYGTVTRNPYLIMISAQGTLIPGWLASTTDMLAEDWIILPPYMEPINESRR